MERSASHHVPADAAALFNPAYCAAILQRVSSGYQSVGASGLPYPLTFLALPLLLHTTSAERLPSTARARLHTWLLSNPEVVVGLADRARSLAPFVRQAIAFGLQARVFKFVEPQFLAPISSAEIRIWGTRSYSALTAKKAVVVGKLFSQIPDVPTIFSLFGVRP